MVQFGVIIAANNIQVEDKSVYLNTLSEWAILRRLVNEMDKSIVREWAVVLGHDHDLHRRVVETIPVRTVIDEDWHKGFEHQVLEGLKEMPPQADGFIILPGDLPFFSAVEMNAMSEALTTEKGFIIVPAVNDTLIPYPLFHRKMLGEIQQRLKNGTFFEIIEDHPAETYEISFKDEMSIFRVTDSESLQTAREYYFRTSEGGDVTNPQAEIPQ